MLFLLAQVLHNQREIDEASGESPFTLFASDEKAFLCVSDAGEAVGFCTVKEKGASRK